MLLSRKTKMEWSLIALSILAAGGAVALLIISLDRYLLNIYAPYLAALICAGSLLVLCFIFLITLHHQKQCKMQYLSHLRDDLGKSIHSIVEDVFSDLENPIKDNPKTAVLLATVAGFLSARYRG